MHDEQFEPLNVVLDDSLPNRTGEIVQESVAESRKRLWASLVQAAAISATINRTTNAASNTSTVSRASSIGDPTTVHLFFS